MTIDTNIVIAYLKGEETIVQTILRWREDRRPFFLSSVAEAEVLAFSGFTEEEFRTTERFLEENFTAVVFDRPLARIAAAVRRDTKIKFPDAAIAATAMATRTPLVTRNVRDFKRITGLQILTL